MLCNILMDFFFHCLLVFTYMWFMLCRLTALPSGQHGCSLGESWAYLVKFLENLILFSLDLSGSQIV